VWESVGGIGKHLIRNFVLRNLLKMVNPTVSNTYTKLQ
jgi:hypothetical protein